MTGTAAVPRRRGGCLLTVVGTIVVLLAAGLLVAWGVQRYVRSRLAPDPTTIARAGLEGLREQNRLSAFAARFVAVVTSRQSMLGLSDEKTLIMPGNVRYEVDLGKLQQRDVRWDAGSRTLSVRLPPVEADQPQVDLAAIREYGSGGLLSRFTSADQALDAANRNGAQAELVRQANASAFVKLARDATRRAVERSFAMPLRAAGLDASVTVRFADEPTPATDRWDVSRSIDDVVHNRY